ncbi:MAG: hydrogenase formation protein HypD [Planctomycetes bacterium]|nr:hydrogenase formation protein HypD [Planctomycetota bacterium]
MKYVDEFRQSKVLTRQLTELRQSVTQRWVIMDVCGGQTHAFLRYGLEGALDDVLELIHGPGCPVCVTPAETIGDAMELTLNHHVTLASFGDMLRVPGATGSLLQARARGADVRIVYSPMDAVQLAVRNPAREVVFFGVGFETTAPATALALLQARQLGLTNFSVLDHHVRVEPAMRAILQLPNCRVQGFLAAGHVCTVTGFAHYEELVRGFQVPIVVTGFEPVDLLSGLSECVRLLEQKTPALENRYSRSARPTGNARAQQLLDEVFQVATIPWRGFGRIAEGGLRLRAEFQSFDARVRFSLESAVSDHDGECQSGLVLSGQIKPPQCPLFGNACTPDQPRGAPMVSSEGACAAYFRYAQTVEASSE